MNWDEYVELSRVLLSFYALSNDSQDVIMLMIDGLQFRRFGERV